MIFTRRIKAIPGMQYWYYIYIYICSKDYS